MDFNGRTVAAVGSGGGEAKAGEKEKAELRKRFADWIIQNRCRTVGTTSEKREKLPQGAQRTPRFFGQDNMDVFIQP